MIIDKTTEQEVTINVFLAKNLADKAEEIEQELKNLGINSVHIISVSKDARNDLTLYSLNCKGYENESRFSHTVVPVLKRGLIVVSNTECETFNAIGSSNKKMAHAIFENGKLILIKTGCIYCRYLDEAEGSTYYPLYNNYTEEEFWDAFSIYSHNEFEFLINLSENFGIEEVVQTSLP